MRGSTIRVTLIGFVLVVCAACASTAPPLGYVWGEVRTAEDQPAPNVPIAVTRLEDGQTVSPSASTMTNGEGRYMVDIRQLPPGDYVVILNPGISMAGGHVGGQTTIALNGPDDSHHLDWTLTANPPVLPNGE